jgi:hypothetical protein
MKQCTAYKRLEPRGRRRGGAMCSQRRGEVEGDEMKGPEVFAGWPLAMLRGK